MAFRAEVTQLIQLYIVGVFVSFTLSQIGMVRHWQRIMRGMHGDGEKANVGRREARIGLAINASGATLTAVVLVIVTITKFTHGAWIVFLAIPVLAVAMIGVHRYYRDVEHEIRIDDTTHFGSAGDVALILVGRLQKPVIKAIDYALAAKHVKTIAVHVSTDHAASERLQEQWREHRIPVPLVIIESPYRTFAAPVEQFIRAYREKHGSNVVTVYLPQYIVGHWWESILHNRRARRIATQLMLVHGVTITLVPWLLDSSELIYGRRSRPLLGQDRSGIPAIGAPLRREGEPPVG